jgi:putative Mg2+ transporter-C (MgtC) family protein
MTIEFPAVLNFNPHEFLNTFLSLTVALVMGTLIGAERQYRQRNAGLRTNALVALGAAAFVDLGMRLEGNQGATHILAYVASGVGFLGAGVILKDGTNIRGLNTAATIWCSAITGGFAGADRPAEAILLTGFILAGNTFLRPIVKMIERAPVDESAAEATFEIRLAVNYSCRDEARDALIETLESENYPVRIIHETERQDEVELVAILATTSVAPDELTGITDRLRMEKGVRHASWTSRADD